MTLKIDNPFNKRKQLSRIKYIAGAAPVNISITPAASSGRNGDPYFAIAGMGTPTQPFGIWMCNKAAMVGAMSVI